MSEVGARPTDSENAVAGADGATAGEPVKPSDGDDAPGFVNRMPDCGPSVPTGSSAIARDVARPTTTVYGSKPTCSTVSVSPSWSPSTQKRPSGPVRVVRTPSCTADRFAPAIGWPRASRTVPHELGR